MTNSLSAARNTEDADDVAALEYERADLLVRHALKRGIAPPPTRAANWCVMAHRMIRATEILGRVPAGADPVGNDLVPWVKYQRVWRDNLNAFQVAFLEAVPGWSWAPWEDAWDQHAADFESFVEKHGSPPRIRSTDPTEHALSAWFGRQRRLLRNGRLPYARCAEVRRLQGLI